MEKEKKLAATKWRPALEHNKLLWKNITVKRSPPVQPRAYLYIYILINFTRSEREREIRTCIQYDGITRRQRSETVPHQRGLFCLQFRFQLHEKNRWEGNCGEGKTSQ